MLVLVCACDQVRDLESDQLQVDYQYHLTQTALLAAAMVVTSAFNIHLDTHIYLDP